MARRFVQAGSQYLECATTPVTGVPLTLACWGLPADATAQTLLTVTATSGRNNFILALGGISTTGKVSAATISTGGSTEVLSAIAFMPGVWSHFCGVFSAVNFRAVFLNGRSKATDTTSVTPSGVTAINVGSGYYTSGSRQKFMSGLVAWPAVWNAALTDAEVAQLAQGTDPRVVRPQNLVAFWPLDRAGEAFEFDASPYPLSGSRPVLVVSGAKPAQDPFVTSVSRRLNRFQSQVVASSVKSPSPVLACSEQHFCTIEE